MGLNTRKLVIIPDDCGKDYLGGDWIPDPRAPALPNLNGVIDGGLKFTNFWAALFCAVARGMLVTGRWPRRTGMGAGYVPGAVNLAPISESETTIHDVFRAAGWATCHLGKWHLGWATTLGVSRAPDLFVGTEHNLNEHLGETYTNWPKIRNGVTAMESTHATTYLIDEAIAWLGDSGEKKLCILAVHSPHRPYHYPPGFPGDGSGTDRDRYKAMLEHLDYEIGRLLAAVGDDIDVFMFPDNGTPDLPDGSGITLEPFVDGRTKGEMYNSGIGPVMAVKGPSVVGPRRRKDNHLVNVVDFFATLCDLSGVPHTTDEDSVSFAGAIQNDANFRGRPWNFTEYFTKNFDPTSNPQRAVRNRRWKLIRRAGKPDEMYDLYSDPLEQNNLAYLKTAHTIEAKRALERLLQSVDGDYAFPIYGTDAGGAPYVFPIYDADGARHDRELTNGKVVCYRADGTPYTIENVASTDPSGTRCPTYDPSGRLVAGSYVGTGLGTPHLVQIHAGRVVGHTAANQGYFTENEPVADPPVGKHQTFDASGASKPAAYVTIPLPG